MLRYFNSKLIPKILNPLKRSCIIFLSYPTSNQRNYIISFLESTLDEFR